MASFSCVCMLRICNEKKKIPVVPSVYIMGIKSIMLDRNSKIGIIC